MCGYMRQVVLVYKCVQGHVLLLKVNTNRDGQTDRARYTHSDLKAVL